MDLLDNVNRLLGDDLKATIGPGSRLRIAASCFSIYAFEALKRELDAVDAFEFIFTSPTFVPDEVTDSGSKERREFHIPKRVRERSFYGTEFELQLKNQLTQRAIAKECGLDAQEGSIPVKPNPGTDAGLRVRRGRERPDRVSAAARVHRG